MRFTRVMLAGVVRLNAPLHLSGQQRGAATILAGTTEVSVTNIAVSYNYAIVE